MAQLRLEQHCDLLLLVWGWGKVSVLAELRDTDKALGKPMGPLSPGRALSPRAAQEPLSPMRTRALARDSSADVGGLGLQALGLHVVTVLLAGARGQAGGWVGAVLGSPVELRRHCAVLCFSPRSISTAPTLSTWGWRMVVWLMASFCSTATRWVSPARHRV